MTVTAKKAVVFLARRKLTSSERSRISDEYLVKRPAPGRRAGAVLNRQQDATSIEAPPDAKGGGENYGDAHIVLPQDV